ncbi:MAG: hypothetical protein GXP31_06895 [Kiritimatiellaeota bacterium]|nr:hypothetical protein [Kiritimatiellota bacterium]
MRSTTPDRTTQPGNRPSARCVVTAGLATALVLTGCSFSLVDLAPRPTPAELYELQKPLVTPVKDAWCRDLVLAIEPFTTPDKYDTRFYSRRGAHKVVLAKTARWVESPGPMIADLLHASLLDSGLFLHVTDARSGLSPDLRLTGAVLTFEKQFGNGRKNPEAVLRVSAVLTAEHDLPPAVQSTLRTIVGSVEEAGLVWKDTFEAREPVAGKSPEAFAAAMSVCLQRVAEKLARSIAAAGAS